MANRFFSVWVSSLLLMAVALPAVAQAQIESVTPGTLQASSNIQSIGLEWRVLNDADHDAVATVDYRPSGASAWKTALPLIRVDVNGVNMLAGSVLFLAPGTSLRRSRRLTDPDGGGETRTATVRTRRLPELPRRPGPTCRSGMRGRGRDAVSPFGGIARPRTPPSRAIRFCCTRAPTAAASLQQAGDRDDLHRLEGRWRWRGGTHRHRSGGQPHLAGRVDGQKSGVRTVIAQLANQRRRVALSLPEQPLWNLPARGGTNWYIADNTVVGDTPATSGSFSGEGIDLNTTSGHTVAHNNITNVADGISIRIERRHVRKRHLRHVRRRNRDGLRGRKREGLGKSHPQRRS